jgi:hypothetical protein
MPRQSGGAGEDEAGAHQGGQRDEVGADEDREEDAEDDERSGADAHLALEANDSRCAAVDGQTGLDPGLRTALDDDSVCDSRLIKFLGGLESAYAGLAKQVNVFDLRKLATFGEAF